MEALFTTRFFDLPSSLFLNGNALCVDNGYHRICSCGKCVVENEACCSNEMVLIEDAFIALSPTKHLTTEHRILQTLYYVKMKPFGESVDLFIDNIVELEFDYDECLLRYQYKNYRTIKNYCVELNSSQSAYHQELFDFDALEKKSYDEYYRELLKNLFPTDALFMKALQTNVTTLIKNNILLSHKVLTYMKIHKGEEWLLERIHQHSFYGEDCEDAAYAFERYMYQNSRWPIPSLALENFDQLSCFLTKVSDIEVEKMDKFFLCQLEFSKPEDREKVYNSHGMMYTDSDS